ncbi:MAG TPA: TolC family protein [Chitinophagaceae bacterium]|nr:TolC family protein [Chitinophagaceae bacterium]
MLRHVSLFFLFIFLYRTSGAQGVLTKDEAVNSALNNQRNLKAATLNVQQQQQLLRGSAALESPQLQYQLSPYDEGAQIGVQQNISFPSVYNNRKALQTERIRLAQLQVLGSQYDLKREVRLSYLQLQYLAERRRLLLYQDSIYAAIKASSKRFFDAGQINKLEELQATAQADAIQNELFRSQADLEAEKQIFRFYTAYKDSINTTPVETYVFLPTSDTLISNVQQQILQQQIAINQSELGVAKAGLLPELQAGVLFPTISQHQRPVGFQFGLTIPIWRKQNRSRITAAQTGIEMARAQQELEQQRLYAQYRQAVTAYNKELQSLTYYNSTALPQAKAIIETSQRLFQGGELNYIESLRNLQTAFNIFSGHLETHRAYNEAVINLAYLNGTL